jgi:GMP synthase (glutamine-hydrolysing)
MKILLINNHSKHLKKLQNILKNCKVQDCKITTIDFQKVTLDYATKFDAIILSGGYHVSSVVNHPEVYSNELKIIKKSNKPILGICLGFELIACSYNENLTKRKFLKKDIVPVKILEQDELFNNIPLFHKHIKAYESHIWTLRTLKKSSKFQVLAKSKYGIEVIKHKTKPIYGVQFHPEMFKTKTHAYRLIENFIKMVRDKDFDKQTR